MSIDAAHRVAQFLDGATSRVRRFALLRGLAVGLACAGAVMLAWSLYALVTRRPPTMAMPLLVWLVIVIALLAPLIAAWMTSRTLRASIASRVEAKAQQFQNRLVTADEITRADAPARGVGSVIGRNIDPGIAALVTSQAAAILPSVDLATLFPSTRANKELGAAAVLLIAALLMPASRSAVRSATAPLLAGNAAASPGIDDVSMVVVSPPYAGVATRTIDDPTRVEALEDSRLRITVRSSAPALRITSGDGAIPTTRIGTSYDAVLSVATDGFVSIEALDGAGKTLARRLIGITSVADQSPRVRIVTPKGDLVLRSGTQTLPLVIEADDDLALAALTLRYTKVSGSGERYTFADGEVPLRLSRENARVWKASAQWSLGSVQLSAGDMVVYRAVTRDRRPGRAPVESDALIAQLLSGDGDAALGFAVDPEEDRQAVSQQMVVLKTERLLAKKASMTDSAFANASRDLAIEQRRVRAEFVFMMGGEMAEAVDASSSMGDLDEHAEAEAESDLSAGRMVNRGRTSLLTAIRSMSRAMQSFEATTVPSALDHAKRAVNEIQDAFARSRFLMRALSQREQLDFTRRGSGELTDAHRMVYPVAIADRDERIVVLRGALNDLSELGVTLTSRTATPAERRLLESRVSDIAERVLRVDAGAMSVKRIADDLIALSRAIGDEKRSAAGAALDRASTATAALLRETMRAEAMTSLSSDARRLSAAMADHGVARGLPRP